MPDRSQIAHCKWATPQLSCTLIVGLGFSRPNAVGDSLLGHFDQLVLVFTVFIEITRQLVGHAIEPLQAKIDYPFGIRDDVKAAAPMPQIPDLFELVNPEAVAAQPRPFASRRDATISRCCPLGRVSNEVK